MIDQEKTILHAYLLISIAPPYLAAGITVERLSLLTEHTEPATEQTSSCYQPCIHQRSCMPVGKKRILGLTQESSWNLDLWLGVREVLF